MAVYVITWNLNHEKPNYSQARTAFIQHLERMENIGDSGLESVRWVSSTSTADQVSAYLRQKMDDNDRLFVSKLSSGQHQGWLSQAVWDWINARL
jgi:hypothetical protein